MFLYFVELVSAINSFVFSDDTTLQYVNRYGLPDTSGFYIVTNNFRRIVQSINKKEKSIILTGPSGFGKSCSLLALWHYYQSNSDFTPIILTPKSILHSDKMVLTQQDIISFTGKIVYYTYYCKPEK